MVIIPYFFKKPANEGSIAMRTLWVFLTAGGTAVWETDEADAKASDKFIIDNYLTPNGLFGMPGMRANRKNSAIFIELDMNKTNINNFYSWSDFLKTGTNLPENIEIFRPFILLDNNDEWGWKEECKKYSLGKFGSLHNLLEGLRES